ncbi:sensor histidine kinase [Streptomyces sp. JJ38]|uniref:sensor histidine kinase n=1 Tax=Streptomyces sp. JJ38 TaxID=2738128 RepID=UPI001C596D1D|nr:histidine kinase [Streptomyces sp. JJ38]MBW1597426.1 two-component sensor histidine kinase [Streptomyces sp. JJ38]
MPRRSAREWFADTGFFLFAIVFSVLTFEDALAGDRVSEEALFYEQVVGALACAALFLRRRWPVPLAVVLLVAGTFSHFVTGAIMVAVFTVAAHRPLRVSRWVGALAAAPLPVVLLDAPDVAEPDTVSALVYFALVAASFGWGLYTRSRRLLLVELRDRADRAAREARRHAREDIAREMHDVLAHRLSLLSVHAGALEFRPDAPAEEVRRASGVIRDSAHQALEDLREIIGVLRSSDAQSEGGAGGDGDRPRRPQPTLGDLAGLVDESREAGMRVALELRVAEDAEVPTGTGRTVYRVVQEALTNARKHAPGAGVTVAVGGRRGAGLEVEVRNAVPGAGGDASPDVHEDAIPGGGQGLVGLGERVRLAGGRLQHGRAGDEFRLTAWLPWSG